MSEEEKEDPNKPTLTSPPALAFWLKHFQEDEQPTDKKFATALLKVFEDLKEEDTEGDLVFNESLESQKLFAKLMVERIFWPAEDLTSPQNPGYVDKACVQFAMKTFGPWRTLFQTIHLNMEDPKQPHKPLQFFHGRTPKNLLDKKLKAGGEFALRYTDGSQGLILSWAKVTKDHQSGIAIKDEKVRRRRVRSVKKKKGKKKKSKKKDSEPVPDFQTYWTYEKKVAIVGGVRTDTFNFDNLSDFLNHKKGVGASGTLSGKKTKKPAKNIDTPIMFGSAYQTFGTALLMDTSSMSTDDVLKAKADKAELDNMVDGINLDAFNDED